MRNLILLYNILFILLLINYIPSFGQALPPTNGLVAYYPMNNATGTTLPDASNNGHVGNFVNTATGAPSIAAAGRVESCVEMTTNQSGYIHVPTLTWTPTAFSVSFWLNPYSFTLYSHMINSSSGWGGFQFNTSTSGGVGVGTSLNTYMLLGAGTVKLNEWQHFTFTFAGGVGKFYKNGQLIGSRSGMAAPLAWGGFSIGREDANSSIHGKVDEVRVYNRAISEEEVVTIAAWPHGPFFATWKSTPMDTDWNNGANWPGGVVPTNITQVTVNACTICPQLTTSVSMAKLTLNQNSSLSLASHTLSSASIYFDRATIFSSGGKVHTPHVQDIRLCTFKDGAITIDISPEGTGGITGGNTYEGPITYRLQRTWNGFNHGHGAIETFKEKATFINDGTGPFSVVHTGAAGTVFEKKAEFKNLNQGSIGIGQGGGITFKDTVIIHQQSTNSTTIAYHQNAHSTFLGPVFINNKSSLTSVAVLGTATFHHSLSINNEPAGRVEFGVGGGKTILTANATFHHGNYTNWRLYMRNFIYENTTVPFTLDIAKLSSADPLVQIVSGCVFHGEVLVRAPHIMLDGATYHQKATFEKIGGNNGWSANCQGGNIFHKETFIRNLVGIQWNMGHNAKDIYNGDVSVSHQGGLATTFAYYSGGNEFHGNLTFNTPTGTPGSIQLGPGSGTATLDEGKVINTSGFMGGNLFLNGLLWKGTGAQHITLPSTSTAGLTLGARSVFEGVLTATAPHLYLNGATFNQSTFFTKKASGNNVSIGGNTFKGKFTLLNQASSGTVNLASQNQDLIAY